MESTLLNLLEKTRSIGTWTVDLKTSAVHWGPAIYAIHEEDPSKQLSLEEAIQYYIPEHRPIIERCIESAIERREPWDVELQLLTVSGRRRWVRAIGEPVFEDDELVGLQGIFEDIDQRKSLEVDREALLHRMFEGERIGKLGHWSWNVTDDTLQWSPGVHKIFGSLASESPLTQAQHMAMVVPDDRARLKAEMQSIVTSIGTSPKRYKLTYRALVDGQEKYIESEGFPRFDVDGKFVEYSGVTVDRTSEYNSRCEIEELHRRLMLALDASGVGVWEWDLQTDALIWDSRMYGLYGIDEAGFGGAYEAWQAVLHPQDRDDVEKALKQAIAQRAKFNAVFRVVWTDGTVRNLQGVADVVVDIQGKPQRMIGVNWDITDAVMIRNELERSNHELAQFAYRTSHDLKGPLTSIRRVAEYMLQDIDDRNLDEVTQNTKQIMKRAEAMEAMVVGILDAAKAELAVTLSEPIDLEEIVNEVIESTQLLCVEKGVRLRATIDCAEPIRLPRIRIYQILYNLYV